jgi:O-antigen/teichoic acid export membrane protein
VNLRRRAFSGVRWSSFSALARAGASFLQLAILARFVEPADFGRMALVFAVLSLVQLAADLGVGGAVIQRQRISAEQLSSLYWLGVAAGASLAALVALASPWVAAFYGEPELQPLLMIVALGMLVESLWQQLRLLSEKELRFERLAQVEIGASLAGLAVAVAIAVNGGGAYAIAGGALATSVASASLGWLLLSQGWRPALRLRVGEIREFLSFGAYAMATNLVNTVNLQVDVMLGLRMLGATATGLYSMPKNLCLQIVGTINPMVSRVAFPLMAKAQQDVALLRDYYLQVMRLTASSNFPVFVAVAAFAPEITRIVFGPQWDEAVPLLRVLACWALLRSTGNPVGSLLMARGRVDLGFRWNLAWMGIFAAAAYAGSQFGALGMALALLSVSMVGQLPNWYFLVRPLCGARFGEYFRTLAVPLALALLAGAAALAAVSLPVAGLGVDLGGALPRLAAGLAVGAAAYWGLCLVFNREWTNAVLELLGRRG